MRGLRPLIKGVFKLIAETCVRIIYADSTTKSLLIDLRLDVGQDIRSVLTGKTLQK